MIERWKYLHEWWVEDFKFEVRQQEEIKAMILRHPDDEISNGLRETLKLLDKRLKKMSYDYKKIYGNIFNMRHIRCEIQGAL